MEDMWTLLKKQVWDVGTFNQVLGLLYVYF